MTTTTCSAFETTVLSLDAENVFVAKTFVSTSDAPGSSNGISPLLTFATT